MKTRQNSYLRILLISYIAILLISLFSGIFDYFVSKNMMEDEVFRSNSAILKQASTYIDTVLNQEELLLIDIGLNSRINEFINVKGPVTESDQYKLYNIIKDMSIYKNKYPYISEYYIYFKNTDKIVTSSSVYNSKMFYEYIYGYRDMEYDEWKESILNGYHENTFLLSREMKQKPHNRYLTYVRSLPINLKQNINANLIVLIDEQILISLLGDLQWLNNGLLFIADNQGNIITSSTSEVSMEDIPELNLSGDEGYSVIKTKNGNMALSYVSSEQQGWKYVSLMPMKIYMEKASKIKNTTIMNIMASLLIGLGMALLFTYRNYSPVKKIMNALPGKTLGDSGSKTNEFDYIEKTINQTFEKDKKIQVMLEEQKPIIRDNMIQRLIKRKFNMQQESYVKTIGSFGIDFPYGLFGVIVIGFDRQQIISAGYSEEKWTLCKLKIFEYLIKTFSNSDMKTYVTDIDGNTVLLVNVAVNTTNQAKSRLVVLANQALAYINGLVETHCTIGIGSLYDSVSGINKSYTEAMSSLDYKIFKEYGPVIVYDEIEEGDQSYYYSIKTEQQLANYIKAGKLESAMRTIENVFDDNINKRRLAPDTLKLLFYEIVGTIVKVIINDMKIDYKSVFPRGFNPTTCLAECVTTEDIKYKFHTILNNLCTFINNNKKSHNTMLTNNIIEYIEKEYTNHELCLQSIATVFNITVPYLSRFFKEQTGSNLNKYINDMRVEKAKALLSSQNITISEVAKSAGFNNDSSFIRVFKKSSGMTPSTFRHNESQSTNTHADSDEILV